MWLEESWCAAAVVEVGLEEAISEIAEAVVVAGSPGLVGGDFG